MFSIILDTVLKGLDRQGIDPFTWRFMFDEIHAEKRNGVFLSNGTRQTLLSLIIAMIDDKQRERIFPGTFDLGSMTVSDAIFTKTDLVNELHKEFMPAHNSGDEHFIPSKAFKHIDPWIVTITGQTIEQHMARNSLKTLKVIKLFYRLMKQRRRTVFQLIRPLHNPRVKASLEHRDRYPLRGNEEQVWLLADLKAYLRIELAPTRAARIDAVFEALLPRLEETINHTNGYLTMLHGAGHQVMEQAVNAMIESTLKEFDLALDIQTHADELSGIPLDERLYLHLHSLDFLNYAGEYTKIIEATVPQTLITPIPHEIEMLREKVLQYGASPYSGGPIAPLTKSLVIYTAYKADLIPLIEKATGIHLNAKQYDSLIKPAEELLYRYHMVKWEIPDPDQYPLGIFEYLAAACTIWHEKNTKTTYEPFWFGQQAPGRKILHTLDQPLKTNKHSSSESVPEALHQIWVGRYRWMADAIKGKQQVHAIRSAANLTILHRVAAAVKTGDITVIEKALSAQPSFIKVRPDSP